MDINSYQIWYTMHVNVEAVYQRDSALAWSSRTGNCIFWSCWFNLVLVWRCSFEKLAFFKGCILKQHLKNFVQVQCLSTGKICKVCFEKGWGQCNSTSVNCTWKKKWIKGWSKHVYSPDLIKKRFCDLVVFPLLFNQRTVIQNRSRNISFMSFPSVGNAYTHQ